MNKTHLMVGTVVVLVVGLLAGCGEPASDEEAPVRWERVSADELSGKMRFRYRRAERARQDLAKTLFGRLSEVLPSEGPASAIEVCNLEAQGMTDEVGEKHDVQIGRTSFRLRNPENTPPDWAREFMLVAKRVDEQVVLKNQHGGVAVFTPIHLQEKCAACHGPEDRLGEDVKAALAERYPEDEATGFEPGDLRGWFWAEASSTDS